MTSIGLRRENKNQWERRVGLVPADVSGLDGVKVIAQSSDLRVFQDEEYAAAGAEIASDLGGADFVIGVKEIPVEELAPNRPYLYFSHTIKSQPYNMDMLQHILDHGITLLDHELITDEEGKRLVAFGRFAGLAGAFETLRALGLKWAAKGRKTALADIKQPMEYKSLNSAMAELERLGGLYRSGGDGPLLIAILGDGKVSSGVKACLDALGTEWVAPNALAGLSERSDSFIAAAVFNEEDMVRRKDGGAFDLQEFYAHPEHYVSVVEGHLDTVDVLFNGIFWTPKYPVYVPKSALKGLSRLCVIGDITCDIEGSIEVTYKATTPGAPNYTYLPGDDRFVEGVVAEGITVMAVDILPCEFPREASANFSSALTPFLPALVKADWSANSIETAGLPGPLERAVIVWRGELLPRFEYLRAALPSAS